MTGIENIVRFEDSKRCGNPLDNTLNEHYNVKWYLEISLSFDYMYYPTQPIWRW